MEAGLLITFSYRMEGHDVVSGDDTSFYQSLPNSKNEYYNTATGRPEVPLPADWVQMLTIVGNALLSSSVLAAAIKVYLGNRKVKISISSGKQKISFEGPNLKESENEIIKLIDVMASESSEKSLRI